MSYGLQVFNSGNVAQIDSEYVNLGLRDKITVQSTPGYGGQYFVLNTAQYTSPVIAVDFSGTIAADYGYVPGAIIDLTRHFIYFKILGTTTRSATFYIFDETQFSETTGSYGLQVYNQFGEVAADSGRNYLKVVDQWQGLNSATGFESFSLPGRKILPVFSRSGITPIGTSNITDWRLNAATISLGAVSRTTLTFGTPEYESIKFDETYHMLVVDVTGF